MKDRVSYDEQNYDLEQNYPSKLERDPDFARGGGFEKNPRPTLASHYRGTFDLN